MTYGRTRASRSELARRRFAFLEEIQAMTSPSKRSPEPRVVTPCTLVTVETQPLRANPPARRDGRCVCCGGERPEMALRGGDPFCSRRCAHEWHGEPDDPSQSKPT